ncbi:Hypothetical predicted protein [Cloeon dipterum]|uniref:Uncharacterized protein n=1 Tax=Cloeon dipterum TaxID=197152 RepID=A0A8S1E4W6_9INSE|nr:Hypothetical predicted protein [Cloeon dipterum]
MKAMAVRERLIGKVSSGASRFILAALNSGLHECVDIFEEGKSFQETSDFGCTFLHAAALNRENGYDIIMHFLPNEMLEENKSDSDGDQAVHYAIMAKNFNAAELLLRFFRSHEYNLLHFLVVQNRLELAQSVHEWKKDLIKEPDPDGRNALHLAAEYAGKEMCKWLMQEADFDVNVKSKSGETALHFALKAEKTDIAKDLVRSGADLKVKLDVDNLLHYCIKLKKLRSVKFVHEHDGELIEEKGQEENVAIQIAAQFADREIFEWLNSILKKSIAASGAKSPLLSLSPEPAVLLFELTVRNATLAATFQIHPKSFFSNRKQIKDSFERHFERKQIENPCLFVIQNSLQEKIN